MENFALVSFRMGGSDLKEKTKQKKTNNCIPVFTRAKIENITIKGGPELYS